ALHPQGPARGRQGQAMSAGAPAGAFLGSLPPWAAELVRAVQAKQSNTFLIHGVPGDLVPLRGPAGLRFLSLESFLTDELVAQRPAARPRQRVRAARLVLPELRRAAAGPPGRDAAALRRDGRPGGR